MSGIAVWNAQIHDGLFAGELHKEAYYEWQVRTWGGLDEAGADVKDWLYAEIILKKELGKQPTHQQVSDLAYKMHEHHKMRDWLNAKVTVCLRHRMVW